MSVATRPVDWDAPTLGLSWKQVTTRTSKKMKNQDGPMNNKQNHPHQHDVINMTCTSCSYRPVKLDQAESSFKVRIKRIMRRFLGSPPRTKTSNKPAATRKMSNQFLRDWRWMKQGHDSRVITTIIYIYIHISYIHTWWQRKQSPWLTIPKKIHLLSWVSHVKTPNDLDCLPLSWSWLKVSTMRHLSLPAA